MHPTIDPLAHDSGLSLFVCGLAWFAGAVLVLRGSIQNQRSAHGWLLPVAASQCLENWLQVAVSRAEGMALFGGLSLALWAFSVVGLVEYAARRFKQPPLWIPQRWVYIPLALWAAFSVCYLQGSGLEIAYQIAFAWAVIALTAKTAISAQLGTADRWQILSLVAIAGYSLAVCRDLREVCAVLALSALFGFWRSQKLADDRARDSGAEPGRSAPRWRRWAMPAAFTFALVAGCFFLGTSGVPSSDEVSAPEPSLDQLYATMEEGPVQPADDELERQLKRCGMAAGPILGLVLAVWGLSRLPFAR